MIQIISDKLNNEEIKQIHKLLCAFHKIDYSLSIDCKNNLTTATMEEI
jgi:hypothetical protein